MAHTSLKDSYLTINLSVEQYDTLITISARANALTQVVLAVTDFDLLPAQILRDFLGTLDSMLYQLNVLSHALKTQSSTYCHSPVTMQTVEAKSPNLSL